MSWLGRKACEIVVNGPPSPLRRAPFEHAVALITIIYGFAYVLTPQASLLLREAGQAPLWLVLIWGLTATMGGHFVLIGLHQNVTYLLRSGFYLIAAAWLSLTVAALVTAGSSAVLVEVQTLLLGLGSLGKAQVYTKVEKVVKEAKEGRL